MESPHLNADDDPAFDDLMRRELSEPPLPDNGFSRAVVRSLPRRGPVLSLRRTALCVAGGVAGIVAAGRIPDFSPAMSTVRAVFEAVAPSPNVLWLATAALAVAGSLTFAYRTYRRV